MVPKNFYKSLVTLTLNGLIPVFFGGVIYIIWRDRSLLMFQWFEAFYYIDGIIAVLRNISVGMPDWFIYNLPGGLWAYSFSYILFYIWRDANCKVKYAWVALVPVIAIGSELGKLLGFIAGTFDIVDIAFYIVFVCLSILVVEITTKNQIKNRGVTNEW